MRGEPVTRMDVEAQRPGYCVVRRDVDLFATDDKSCSIQYGYTIGRGYRTGWCPPSGPVKVWSALGPASTLAQQVGADVVTVPRSNGYCREWTRVAVAPTVDEGWTMTSGYRSSP